MEFSFDKAKYNINDKVYKKCRECHITSSLIGY